MFSDTLYMYHLYVHVCTRLLVVVQNIPFPGYVTASRLGSNGYTYMYTIHVV